MSLRQRVEDELKAAMKGAAAAASAQAAAGTPATGGPASHPSSSGSVALRLETFRMLKSAIKYREIELGQPLDDAAVRTVVGSLIKQRRESAEQYRSGNRAELAAKEEAEIEVLQGLLPAQLGDAELDELVEKAIAATGAKGPKDMGPVMKFLKDEAAGRADGKTLSERVKGRLGRG